jgi:hypothetical protein
MKKLTLDLDRLVVESFAAEADVMEGTVLGHEELIMATRTNVCRTPCCPDTAQPGCTA